MVSIAHRTLLGSLPGVAPLDTGAAASTSKIALGTGPEGASLLVYGGAFLDAAVAYRLAVALHRIERDGLGARQVEQSTAKNTLAALPAPDALHPGVVRYCKEAGLMR